MWQKYNHMWCLYYTQCEDETVKCEERKKGTTKYDNSTVKCDVGTAQYEDVTIKCDKKKNKEITKCDKRTVTCDVGTAQCEDETVKCERKKKELPYVTKVLSNVHNVRMEPSNIRKKK